MKTWGAVGVFLVDNLMTGREILVMRQQCITMGFRADEVVIWHHSFGALPLHKHPFLLIIDCPLELIATIFSACKAQYRAAPCWTFVRSGAKLPPSVNFPVVTVPENLTTIQLRQLIANLSDTTGA